MTAISCTNSIWFDFHAATTAAAQRRQQPQQLQEIYTSISFNRQQLKTVTYWRARVRALAHIHHSLHSVCMCDNSSRLAVLKPTTQEEKKKFEKNTAANDKESNFLCATDYCVFFFVVRAPNYFNHRAYTHLNDSHSN